MPTLDLDGVTLYYEFDPADTRPVLMLSNSLGTNLSMWSGQTESLSQHFSLLRYDTRGHGRSSVPAGPYNVAILGKDVLNLLNALGLDRVNFCGLSMGGMIGQWLGIHAPHRLHRLVLCNTAAKIGVPENWNLRIATINREGMQAIIPAVLKGWFTEDFHREFPAVIARMGAMLQANIPAGYTANCAAVRDMDQRDEVHLITTPTLIVYGTEDKSTPPGESFFLADRIANSRSLGLHAAHISNIEAASTFTKGVLQFLLEGAN